MTKSGRYPWESGQSPYLSALNRLRFKLHEIDPNCWMEIKEGNLMVDTSENLYNEIADFLRERWDLLYECDISSWNVKGRSGWPINSNNTGIKKVIFNGPATIVHWKDGTKTVVKCSPDDELDYEKGLAVAVMKKYFGNGDEFHKIMKRWLPESVDEGEYPITDLCKKLFSDIFLNKYYNK